MPIFYAVLFRSFVFASKFYYLQIPFHTPGSESPRHYDPIIFFKFL